MTAHIDDAHPIVCDFDHPFGLPQTIGFVACARIMDAIPLDRTNQSSAHGNGRQGLLVGLDVGTALEVWWRFEGNTFVSEILIDSKSTSPPQAHHTMKKRVDKEVEHVASASVIKTNRTIEV